MRSFSASQKAKLAKWKIKLEWKDPSPSRRSVIEKPAPSDEPKPRIFHPAGREMADSD